MSILLDLKSGLRGLFRPHNFGYTAISALCLGAGIGAGVTVFSVADAVLMRPLAGVRDIQELVSLSTKPVSIPGLPGMVAVGMSFPTFELYQEQGKEIFSELVVYQPTPLNVRVHDHTVRVAGQLVSDNYFSALHMTPAAGSFFGPGGPGREGAEPVLVISRGFWWRMFGGEEDFTRGMTLTVNGRPFEVAGVAAPGFHGTVRSEAVDVWIPMEAAPLVVPSVTNNDLRDAAHSWLFWFFGRLQPGVDVTRAQARLDVLGQQMAAEATDSEVPELRVFPYVGVTPGQRQERVDPVMYLALAVGLLVFVVCANNGGLLLVRLTGRQGEIGMRWAMGARRSAIIRLLMIEALLLAALGTLVGLAVAWGLMQGLEGAVLGKLVPELHDLSLNVRALVFALVLTLAMAVGLGLLPGILASRPGVLEMIHKAGSVRTSARLWLQETLVVAQVATAVVLIICAGLFIRTLESLESLDLGFDPEDVVNLRLDLELLRYEEPGGMSFYERLLDETKALPGVDSAALALNVPLGSVNGPSRIGGVRPVDGEAEKQQWITFNVISEDYFQTLGISLIRGRDFSPSDFGEDARTMIINREMAQGFFSGTDPIGKTLYFGETPYEVIGVAENVRFHSRKSTAEARFYLPYQRSYEPQMTLHVKSRLNPEAIIGAVTAELQGIDPLAVFETTLYPEEVRRATAGPRLLATLFSGFGAMALILTGIGLYVVLAYSVRRRTRELGVRIALGARPGQVVKLVVGHTVLLTVIGSFVGLGAAFLATRGLAAQLYGVTPTDSAVYVTVVLIGLLVGLLAAVVPALTVVRIDPSSALRYD